MYIKHFWPLFIFIIAGTYLTGCNFIRGYAEGPSSTMLELERQTLSNPEMAKARFVFDDLGHLNTDTLESHAIPWKVALTAVLIYENHLNAAPINLDTGKEILSRFGFIWPKSIKNWPSFNSKSYNALPLGIVSGMVQRKLPAVELEVANLSCASCHASRLYDSQGRPTDEVWLGLPNSSLDLDAYVNYIYTSLKHSLNDDNKLISTLIKLFPEASSTELNTIKNFGLDKARERIKKLEASIDKPLPFDNGGAGITNGVAALKMQLGLLDPFKHSEEYGYTSIPNLDGIQFKSSLLSDGLYSPVKNVSNTADNETQKTKKNAEALAGVIAYFTVPTQGGTANSAINAIPKVTDILEFINLNSSPVFPAEVDYSQADKGRDIYLRSCASCHGEYSGDLKKQKLISYPKKIHLTADINTDAYRSWSITKQLITTINTSNIQNYLVAKQTQGYVAPILNGLWATAPYLHNGSVPSVWHLLNPEHRPKVFEVGGHSLDYTNLGIKGERDENGVFRFPAGHIAKSKPSFYDTRLPGKSSQGHEVEFKALTDQEKTSLIEYLKLL